MVLLSRSVRAFSALVCRSAGSIVRTTPVLILVILCSFCSLAPAQTAYFTNGAGTLGSGMSSPAGMAVDGSGNIYAADSGNNPALKPQTASVNFGSINVGSTSAPFTLTFTFNTAGTLGSTAVLTQGLKGLEFADAGTGSCTASTAYGAGATCTINVTLTPKYSGIRYGAAELLDSNHNIIALAYISGIGVSPLAAFSPGSVSVLNVTGLTTALTGPRRPIFDPLGNVYIADYNNNRIVEISPAGAATVLSTPGITLLAPTGVALDGAGNLFIADSGNGRVVELTAAGTAAVLSAGSVTISTNYGIAVDGSGNVYTGDINNHKIVVYPYGGAAYVLAISGVTLGAPWGVAVDGYNNLFIADNTNSQIVEVTQGTGFVLSTGTVTLNKPRSLSLDSAGNLYISDSGNNRIVEVPAGSSNAVVFSTGSLALNLPVGSAVSGTGDIYIADSGNNRIVVSSQKTPPSLSFATTSVGSTSTDSPQAVTLLNLGNAPLTLPVPTSGMDPSVASGFALDNSSTCPQISSYGSPGILAAGSSCVFAIDFIPVTPGSISGSLVLTDNSLNATGSTQSINLSGTGTYAVAYLAFATPPAATLAVGGNAGSAITVQELNSSSSVITTAADLITLTVSGPNSYTATYTSTSVKGVATFNLASVPLTMFGTYTYTASFSSLSATAMETVTGLTPVVTLTTGLNPVLIQNAVTYTATVTGSSGTPTGTVTFYDGTQAVGSGTLSASGVATLSTAPYATGTQSITASYVGNATYISATSNTVSEVVDDFTLALTSSSSSSIGIYPGSTATINLTVAPVNATSFPAAITLTASGGPSNATLALSPTSIAAGSGSTNLTLSVTVPNTVAQATPKEMPGRRLAPFALALLLLPLAARMRRAGRKLGRIITLLLLLIASAAVTTGLTGCAGNSGYFGEQPAVYTVTITGTSGTLTHSTTITLTVE